MADTISWISLQGVDRDRALEAIGLIDTGMTASNNEGDLRVSELDDRLSVYDQSGRWTTREALAAVSHIGEAVGVWGDMTAGTSEAYGFRNGVEQWAVIYKAGQFTTRGETPAVYDRLRQQTLTELASGPEADDEPGYDPHWDFALTLVAVLDGLSEDGTVPRCGRSRVVEPVRPGKDGVKQMERLAHARKLEARIISELYPVVAALGFQQASTRTDYVKLWGAGAANAFVRLDDGAGAGLTFDWGILDGGPFIGVIAKAAAHWDAPDDAPLSMAVTPYADPTLIGRLFSRPPDRDAQIDKTIADGKTLITAVEAWLTHDEAHPWIEAR